MLRFITLTAALVAALSTAGVASADIKQFKNGFYQQLVSGTAGFGRGRIDVVYTVDTKTRTCFAQLGTAHATLSVISCENLARRKGWSEILTWVAAGDASSE